MDDFQFRKASVLDLPFIFNLIVDGSEEGVFSDRYFLGSELVGLFILLFINVLPFINRFGKAKPYMLLVFMQKKTNLGFLMISTLAQTSIQKIEACAIVQERRGEKTGLLMIKRYIESIPDGMVIQACCTKYARAMQHILSRLGFQRAKDFNGNRLECYFFNKVSQAKSSFGTECPSTLPLATISRSPAHYAACPTSAGQYIPGPQCNRAHQRDAAR